MRLPSSSSGDRGAGSVVSTPSDRIRRPSPPRPGAQAMTDIVERLLEQVDYLPREVRQEAAAEIERLKEVVTRLHAEKRELKADNARLRAALTQAREHIHDVAAMPTNTDYIDRALEPKP